MWLQCLRQPGDLMPSDSFRPQITTKTPVATSGATNRLRQVFSVSRAQPEGRHATQLLPTPITNTTSTSKLENKAPIRQRICLNVRLTVRRR